MTTPPNIGDPVTTVYFTKTGGAVHGTVLRLTRAHLYVTTAGKLKDGQRRLDREGVSWIRGHLPLDSEEVQAMVAAWVLAVGKAR